MIDFFLHFVFISFILVVYFRCLYFLLVRFGFIDDDEDDCKKGGG